MDSGGGPAGHFGRFTGRAGADAVAGKWGRNF